MDADWSDDERGACRMPKRSTSGNSGNSGNRAIAAEPCGALGRDLNRSIALGPSPEKQQVEYVDYEFEGMGRAAGAVWAGRAGYDPDEADELAADDAGPPDAAAPPAAGGPPEQATYGPEPPLPPKHMFQAYT